MFRMKKFILFLLMVSFFCLQVGYAQITDVRAELDKLNRRIDIYYNLQAKGEKYDKFEIELYLSEDGGETFERKLEYVTGQYGKNVTPGLNKKMVWLYFKEMPEFTGKDIAFKVKAKVDLAAKEARILSLGGPKEALYSAILPGWGDYKVRDGKRWQFFTIGAISYALVGSGLYLRSRSRDNFDKVGRATSASEVDNLISRADGQNTTSTVLINTGIAIWAADLTLALLKGLKNQKAQRKIQQGKVSTSLRILYNPYANRPMFGLNFKF